MLEQLDIGKDDIVVTDKQIEEFAEAMSSQKGVKNKESYKLSIIDKALKNNSNTAAKLKLWLKSKKVDPGDKHTDFDEKYLWYKNKKIRYQNKLFTIVGMIEQDEKILTSAILDGDKIVIRSSKEQLDSLVKF